MCKIKHNELTLTMPTQISIWESTLSKATSTGCIKIIKVVGGFNEY